MRFFIRCTVALSLVLIFLTALPAALAQTKHSGSKLSGGHTLAPALVGAATNYQVTQTTDMLVPGTTPVTGFNCGTGAAGDDCTAAVTLPFSFTLYDQTFTSANVSTNGNLQFNSNNADQGQAAVCFPLSQFSYVIAAHWADLTVAGANEGIFTSVTDPDNDPNTANRIFNIEWRASFIGTTPGSLDFEIRLYEDQNRFDIVYNTVAGNGQGPNSERATIGVQRATGSTFTEYSSGCNFNAVRSGQALVFTGTTDTSLFIAGRTTDPDGNPLSGVTVSLSGSTTGQTQTDGSGNYLFTGLTAGNTYTVTPSQQGFTFLPASATFGGSGNRAFNGNFIINFIRIAPLNPGDVLISEFRFHGPTSMNSGSGSLDEFVELYNNTNATIVVKSTDGTFGWLVQSNDGQFSISIPNGTSIPARGHYLIGNGSGYNLSGYSAPDAFTDPGVDIQDNGGIALFSSTNAANLNLNTRLDAAGFTAADPLYREGAGLVSPGANDGQYSFVRKLAPGTPQDTNDNAADFVFVSVTGGTFGGVPSQLGAPGPESLASPIQRNAQLKNSLIDPTASSTSPPNRVRDATPVTNGSLGTLTIRRRVTNTTGKFITRLRFRIVDITTFTGGAEPPAGTADLRVLSSTGGSVNTGNGTVQVQGLTLEQPPTQNQGGGLNSSLSAGTISVGQPLAPGAAINVEFRLGVQQGGLYRIFINVEALP